ncbi:hypothetical protein ACE3MS_24305 [Paenibacillus dendritiformis]
MTRERHAGLRLIGRRTSLGGPGPRRQKAEHAPVPHDPLFFP